jgi:hypothetical protein
VSLQYPTALLSEPGQSAAVFVAFDIISGSPNATRDGNETSVPPPATELIAPAAAAAVKSAARPSSLYAIIFHQQ